jgi:hypothetical protein
MVAVTASSCRILEDTPMAEMLSTLLLQLLMLLVGLMPGLERAQPRTAQPESIAHTAIAAPAGRDDTAGAASTSRRCEGDHHDSTACNAARMRWQVTLMHSPGGRRCGTACGNG